MPGDPEVQIVQIAPEFARWALRSVLTGAREKAGLSTSEVTEQLQWTGERKIKRIEDGAVAVRPIDLQAMLRIYGITDQTEINELIAFAVASKRKSDWADYADLYRDDARAMFALEGAATTIRKHVPTVVPSLLQTEDYCRALLASNGNTDEQIDRRVEACLARQAVFHRRRLHLDVILAEAVLCRPIGGTAVMRAQIEYLKQLAGQDDIDLRLLPLSVGAYPRLGVAFTVMEFDGHIGDLLFLEDAEGTTTTISQPERIPSYRNDFDHLCHLSVQDEFAQTVDRIVSERL